MSAVPPPLPLCRIAAFGDSLTQGDAWMGPAVMRHIDQRTRSRTPWLNPECRLQVGNCRGNYPRLLQGLLGANAIVRNFGVGGRAAADLLPHACFVSLENASLHSIASNHLLRSMSWPACDDALLHMRKLVELRAFAPHVVVLQLGTNDATHRRFEAKAPNTGTLGFAHALATLIYRGLWRLTARGPNVLYLEPPPTMSDNPYATAQVHISNCVRMHNCRYHPNLACWSVAECITCSAADRLDSDPKPKDPTQVYQRHAERICVRHDALQQIRHAGRHVTLAIAPLARTTSRATRPDATSSALPAQRWPAEGWPAEQWPAKAARCIDESAPPALRWIPTSTLRPSWRFFSGPYHLSPPGSAYLACTVYNALAEEGCADVPCKPRDDNGQASVEAWARHHNVSLDAAPPPHNAKVADQFCDAILAGARGNSDLHGSTLDAMEASLFARPPL